MGFNFRSISDIGNFLLVNTHLFLAKEKDLIKASQPAPKNNNKTKKWPRCLY